MKLAFSRKNLWERMPSRARRLIGSALRAVPLAAILGRKFREERRLIEEAERWSDEQIWDFQLKEIQKQLASAYDASEFVRDQFDQLGAHPADIRTRAEFEKLPTITKDVIRDNMANMLLRDISGHDVDYITTGGTGGTPFGFYINAGRSAREYAYLTKGWERTGFRLGNPKAVLRGRVVRTGSDEQSTYDYDPLLNEHYFSSFHLNDSRIQQYLEKIEALDQCFLHIYPSVAYILARHMHKHEIQSPSNIRGILAESEIVYPDQRQFVERVFSCRYFSSYGHTEKLVSAAECEHSTDYHVWPTYGYAELIDTEGRAIDRPGEVGEIAGTSFMNNVMAFIRYRTGDFAEYVGTTCEACGRNGLILRNIRGHRTQEYIVARDNSLIPWSAVNMHDDTFDNVRQFQFFQSQPGNVTIKVVVYDSFSAEDEARILKNISRKFDGAVAATLEKVSKIEFTSRGKSVFVDQKIPTNQLSE